MQFRRDEGYVASKGVKRIPYREGSLLEWTGYEVDTTSAAGGWSAPDEWRDNVPVEMVLQLAGIERGRSAARFVWTQLSNGATFPMFMIDMAELVMMNGQRIEAGGLVLGKWIVKKRGANYGIALLSEDGI